MTIPDEDVSGNLPTNFIPKPSGLSDTWLVVTCTERAVDSYECSDHFDLFDNGAQGVHIQDDGSLLVYFRDSLEGVTSLMSKLGNYSVISIQPVEDHNWVQHCEKLMEPVKVGEFFITPVATYEHGRKLAEFRDKNQLFLIPGMGFGTGHHPATRLAMELLTDIRIAEHSPKVVLDMGTGSGILALGAVALYGCTVDGVDCDPDALRNASENILLNGFSGRITTLINCSDTQYDISDEDKSGWQSYQAKAEHYDLVLANIYAESLVDMCEHFFEVLKDAGYLVLSGILAEKEELVLRHYLGRNQFSLGGARTEGTTDIDKTEAIDESKGVNKVGSFSNSNLNKHNSDPSGSRLAKLKSIRWSLVRSLHAPIGQPGSRNPDHASDESWCALLLKKASI